MEIQVQSITLREGLTEKGVVAKMRDALPTSYDYIQKSESTITRFSSDELGPIKVLVAYDKIKQEKIGSTENTDGIEVLADSCIIALDYTTDLCTLVKVKDGLIRSVEYVLKETCKLTSFKRNTLIIVEDCIANNIEAVNPVYLPAITNDELKETIHQFTDTKNLNFKPILLLLLAIGLGSVATLQLFSGNETVQTVEVETVEPVEKKVRMDQWYGYKKELVNRAEYSELVTPLIAVALMNEKLPDGWYIEDIVANNTGVSAEIRNNGGRTLPLKHFRATSGYSQFIDIDGQVGRFYYPLQPRSWFRWTKYSDNFESVRDDFMDQMIFLGGKLSSRQPVYHQLHTYQDWFVEFESTSVAFLDIFSTALNNRPIFISEIKLKPVKSTNDVATHITMQARIIGR